MKYNEILKLRLSKEDKEYIERLSVKYDNNVSKTVRAIVNYFKTSTRKRKLSCIKCGEIVSITDDSISIRKIKRRGNCKNG